SLSRVLDVERERVVAAGVGPELRRADREDPCFHGGEALVQEVPRNPGGREVLARRRRLAPAVARVHRIECDVAPLVEDLDLRVERDAVPEDGESNLDPDGTSYVDGPCLLPVLDDSDGAQPHEIVPGCAR